MVMSVFLQCKRTIIPPVAGILLVFLRAPHHFLPSRCLGGDYETIQGLGRKFIEQFMRYNAVRVEYALPRNAIQF